MTTYAAFTDNAIYYISTNPETILDEAAQDSGYRDHAALVEEGNPGFQVARIDPEWAAEIVRYGWQQDTIFDVVAGEVVRISEEEYQEQNEALFGPSTWKLRTVLLEDGTTGTAHIPGDQDEESVIGQKMTIELHDENGLGIQATGIVAEILE